MILVQNQLKEGRESSLYHYASLEDLSSSLQGDRFIPHTRRQRKRGKIEKFRFTFPVEWTIRRTEVENIMEERMKELKRSEAGE